ncbi:MAG TPA: polyphosphate kinase 1, partial [Chitinivibrionales bacterium]
ERTFTNEIFPVLSPIAAPSTLKFPLLAGATLHIAVLRGGKTARVAVIPLPRVLSRIIALPSEGCYEYLLLEDLVAMQVSHFFPGEKIIECTAFRITRDAALRAEDELAADLLVEMTDIVSKRRKSDCLRLEVEKKALPSIVAFLQKGLRIGKDGIYFTENILDFTALMRLYQLPDFAPLKDQPWPPVPLLSLKPGLTMFEAIGRRDILLSHPYDSYDPVIRFVEEAADDPDTIAIKQTLYRTGKKSRIVAALARAAENGKYVTAIVELKARFEEERNIEWARELEDAGVQVIYGIKGFKTHAKVCLVIRKQRGGIKKYVHFGTGNYNEITAQLYTDVSLFTCHDDLAADASSFFNIITGHSQPMQFNKISAAPIDLRETVIAHIEAETEAALQNRPSFIKAKMNSLVDEKIINSLYAASRAGVAVALNIRGICCLRPGVKGLSENISVVSVVDRFLEHSRIFWFHAAGMEKLFISSADWMPRNLDKRCELMVPVDDPPCRKKCMDIIDTCLNDTTNCWDLLSDGRYRRRSPGGRKKIRCQETLYRTARTAAEGLRQARRTVFETHHPKVNRP